MMKVRPLGKSGIKVSALGMGCPAIGGSYTQPSGHILGYGHVKDKDSIKAIHKGLDLGVTLFDTSNVYGCGRNERVLGEALKGRRDEVVLASKFGLVWKINSKNSKFPCQVIGDNLEPDFIRKSCEESLMVSRYFYGSADFEKFKIIKSILYIDSLNNRSELECFSNLEKQLSYLVFT